MILKRNIFTILYTLLFFVIAGIGLFQMTNLEVATTSNKYLVTGIIVFGLILYLIAAYFLKGAGTLKVIQTKNMLLNIFELLFVLVCNGIIFYFNWTQRGLFCAVIFTLLLFCLYAVARLCGGRLCGLISVGISFYFLMNQAASRLSSLSSAFDMLCFLIPFLVFLGIQQLLIPTMGENGFFVVSSYLVLGFVFSLAIVLNPLVFALLAGCIFSLLFAAPKDESCSVLAKGVLSATYLFVFTASLLICIYLFMPGIFQLSAFPLDHELPLTWNVDMLNYMIGKYTRPVIYLYLPFRYGIFPTILFFFTVLAGYYAIRKKSSFMGPVIFSFVVLFVYYIFFCQGGSRFYYLTYFLPIFAAYGFSNTLIAEEPSESVSVGELEETDQVTTESTEKNKEKDEFVIDTEPMEQPTENVTVREEIVPLEASEQREIAPVPVDGDIPEWTMTEDYTLPEGEMVFEEEPLQDGIEQDMMIQEDEPVLLDENTIAVEEESMDNTLDFDLSVPEKPDHSLESHDILPEQELSSVNDIEQFVTQSVIDSSDGTIDLSEETQLNDLLDRLDLSEPIKRMNESAQEDIADVIEREEEQVELSEALPLIPSKSTLPKYQKPNFDFDLEPVNIPLDNQYSNISEYDEVPTIQDLERQWSTNTKPVIETVASQIEYSTMEESAIVEEDVVDERPHMQMYGKESIPHSVHSEEIVRKNGIGKRSYHKITIR